MLTGFWVKVWFKGQSWCSPNEGGQIHLRGMKMSTSSCISEITLEGKKINLFIDDAKKPVLKSLNYQSKITWLEERAKLLLLDPVQEILEKQSKRELSKYHLLNLTTILCCAMEGLGRYMPGSSKPGKAFKNFVEHFMPEAKHYGKNLWEDFRNGLAHGFCIQKGGIEQNENWYFREHPTIALQVNIDRFVSDFERAFQDFFDRLKSESETGECGKSFLKRFEYLFL